MISRRSTTLGLLASLLLGGSYVAVVGGIAGSAHLVQQVRADWWLLGLLLLGFATQVALMSELRHRHRAVRTDTASIGASAGASGLAMAACCAHHVADLAPLAGAAGVATFLTDEQRPLMLAGLVMNAVGVTVAVRRLRRMPPPVTPERVDIVHSVALPAARWSR